jgi:DNA-binding MarR family transcriptional regulator
MLTELRRRLEEPSAPSQRMTMARFDLLASLHRHDGQTLAALSRALLVTAGNVTGLVDRAERDGVVARRPDPDDRRASRVWLTERGRTLIKSVLPIHDKQVHEMLVVLPREERRELRKVLGTLRDHLSPRPTTNGAAAKKKSKTKTKRVSP